MGWSSKFEDEIERREGNEPRQALRRFSTILFELGLKQETAVQQSSPNWNEAATDRLDELAAQIERSLEKRKNILSRAKNEIDFNATKRFLRAQQELSENISELIRFLAPRVLRMSSGPGKRHWQKILRQLKKARSFG